MMPEGEREIQEVVYENLERYRKEKVFTKKELCERAEYSYQSYINMSELRTQIRLTTIQKFAYALGIKTIDLFEDWSDID